MRVAVQNGDAVAETWTPPLNKIVITPVFRTAWPFGPFAKHGFKKPELDLSIREHGLRSPRTAQMGFRRG
jgi:hypothetical protein